MFKDFMKRFAPFVLALKVGLLLVWLLTFSGLPVRDEGRSLALESGHSRTWLVIRHLPAMAYTEQEASEKGAMTTLRLRALLDADGIVSDVELLSPATEEFAKAAMNAAARIRFIPATEDRQPIPLWVTIDYGCSGEYFGHRYMFQCDASIAHVERDWRIIYE